MADHFRNHMADQDPREGSSAINVSTESSESTVDLNIKTLDSRIYNLRVDKNIVVSAFKEKIAGQTGVAVTQQRLIFRGKVLKDDHLLSEYNVENGDTLHLVERQAQPQPPPPPPPGTRQATSSNGRDSSTGGPRNRIGQVAHSVVLGTLNVGDSGEAVGPDLNRVIGSVLHSIGIGGMQPGGQNQGGNHRQPHVMQVPLEAVPTFSMPIPDSLNTLTEFMNRMGLAFTQNGDQPNQTPTDLPTADLPSNSRGLPTVEALSIVLRQAERLLSSHAVRALSHTAGRLEQEGASADPTVRAQVQTESVQLGVAMQHLGALFLELGRAILTLRMGQSPAESFVNAGPAVYISPSGPNPIMVQPFPLQTSSLFGGSPGVAPNSMNMVPPGVGGGPRNVNIHIHTAISRVNNGEGTQGEPGSGADSASPPGADGDSSVASMIDELNAQLRRNVDEHRARSGQPEGREQPMGFGTRGGEHQGTGDQKAQSEGVEGSNNEASTSAAKGSHNQSAENVEGAKSNNDTSAGSSGVPLGLGLGGLQPKRRDRQLRATQSKNLESSSSTQQQSQAVGQQVLQSLSLLSRNANTNTNTNTAPSQNSEEDQADASNVMSELLHSPALDGLLSGVSQQTGVGSPDMLRNMLQQVTQNPTMMNTVNQLAQQLDGQDLGNMFSGLGQGGGGFDIGRMMQQMMPIVSQALGGGGAGPSIAQSNPVMEPLSAESRRSMWESALQSVDDHQIDLHQVAQILEKPTPDEEIFRLFVDTAAHVSSDSNPGESIVDELASVNELQRDFMEMLRGDVSRRFPDENGS